MLLLSKRLFVMFQKLKRMEYDMLLENITMIIFKGECFSVEKIAHIKKKMFTKRIHKAASWYCKVTKKKIYQSSLSNQKTLEKPKHIQQWTVFTSENLVLMNYVEKIRMQYPNSRRLSQIWRVLHQIINTWGLFTNSCISKNNCGRLLFWLFVWVLFLFVWLFVFIFVSS